MNIKSLLLWTSAILTFLPGSAKDQADKLVESKPNIIIVITDDQGMADLSCMGNKVVQTPHIDEFYKNSTRFTDFQVSPTCAPTRATLMSGVAPFKTGVTHTILQRERMAQSISLSPKPCSQPDMPLVSSVSGTVETRKHIFPQIAASMRSSCMAPVESAKPISAISLPMERIST
jgi:hypothetical protein